MEELNDLNEKYIHNLCRLSLAFLLHAGETGLNSCFLPTQMRAGDSSDINGWALRVEKHILSKVIIWGSKQKHWSSHRC